MLGRIRSIDLPASVLRRVVRASAERVASGVGKGKAQLQELEKAGGVSQRPGPSWGTGGAQSKQVLPRTGGVDIVNVLDRCRTRLGPALPRACKGWVMEDVHSRAAM